ncbi:hypothetical protein GCM10023206_19910 [Acinetobacter puyangensis]|uniref:Ferric uptake regulator family protein n=1 Tax=Acinetobacter puyangensis TaxID=1096779 RepID=A0A240EE95_9GAMM|nr:Ferric uptake regulator family protein [Acinetobacter puyangensis]
MTINLNDTNAIRDLLKHKHIKVTLPRLMIYKVMQQSSHAMTAYEIEDILLQQNHRLNWVTIYSTLKNLPK